MEINKTTVYTLSKEEIETACYSAYVRKLEALKVNAWFAGSEIKFFASTSTEDDAVFDMRCELEIVENDQIAE